MLDLAKANDSIAGGAGYAPIPVFNPMVLFHHIHDVSEAGDEKRHFQSHKALRKRVQGIFPGARAPLYAYATAVSILEVFCSRYDF